ncbi:MAG: hypothetical protein LBR85_03270 [Oscillospiraceae bacterium]|jgi:hypothetical protein|nr:hypothetical protein [Oscillospiraceae bacterium]
MDTKTSKAIIFITIALTILVWAVYIIFAPAELETVSVTSYTMPLGLGAWMLYGMRYEFQKRKKAGNFRTQDKIGLALGIAIGLALIIGGIYSIAAAFTGR